MFQKGENSIINCFEKWISKSNRTVVTWFNFTFERYFAAGEIIMKDSQLAISLGDWIDWGSDFEKYSNQIGFLSDFWYKFVAGFLLVARN